MKRVIPFLIFAFMLSMSSCLKDDIDNLQDQIDDLDGKLTKLEQEQNQALLAEIARLEASISNLEAADADIADQYAQMLADLQTLGEEVENNASAVFYGNLLTDEDFANVLAAGSSVVTGKVIVRKADHVAALANVKMIGGNLEVATATTVNIPVLENVAGNVILMDLAENGATVELPMLKSVGNNIVVKSNGTAGFNENYEVVADGLVSVTAPELVLVYGNFTVENNPALTSIAMAKLDYVGGDLYINEMNQFTEGQFGSLVNLDLSATNVGGSVMVSHLGVGSSLAISDVNGDFSFVANASTSLELLTATIKGNLTINQNGRLSTIVAESLTRIEGAFTVEQNINPSVGWGAATSDFKDLSAFDNLEYIGGDVRISNNVFTSIDILNNVTTVKGNIELNSNGGVVSLVNVFNALTETGASQWQPANITISQKTEWFTGFAQLEKAGTVNYTIQKTFDGQTWEAGTVAKLSGFDKLTEAQSVVINAGEATEFDAFPMLSGFGWEAPYLTIYMPGDASVNLCSMSDLLIRIKAGEFDREWDPEFRPAVFYDATWTDTDRDTAIDALLNGCTL